MTAAVKAVLEQAKRLTEDERSELLDELVALEQGRGTLDGDAFAKAWRPELDRRRALLERGELETVDAREFISEARARLRADSK